MKIKLTPKTSDAIDILNKHGEIFKIEYKSAKSYRLTSLKNTNYFPFVGLTKYRFWLQKTDERFDYQVIR